MILISELESENRRGLTYDNFVDRLKEKLRDRESQKSTERVFDLFVEDPKGTVTFEILKKVHQDIGEDVSEDDIRRLIKSGASNGTDIPYDEFHSIMIKNISLK
jgi:Ca2+-binding EF-hand superfamily protein